MKYKKKEDDDTNINDSVLVFDIETDGLNTETSKMKWFGCYSYIDESYYYLTDEHFEDIQKIIDRHKIVVGFNSKDFDIPICENNGLNFEYKIKIDLLRVLYNYEMKRSVRENIIKVDGKILKDLLPNHKLKTIGQVLKLSVEKGDIDYNIFRQEIYSQSDVKQILKYLHADVKLTKELFEYLYKEFLPFKEFMSIDDQRKYNWYRTSPASMVYKIVCHKAELVEEYGERPEGHKNFIGGLVLEPTTEVVENVILFDFVSLYPTIMIQNNVFNHNCNCCNDNDKWSGNNFFDVKGRYCSKNQGVIELFIKDLFLKRMQWKKDGNTSMAYCSKIILNSLYGASSSPLFKNIYTENIGRDITAIGRQCLNTAIEMFESAGFRVIYGDTDSCFVQLNNKSREEAINISQDIVRVLNGNMPFSDARIFNLKIDDEIKKIWFFRDYNNNLKKKNYMYINKDNKIKIKGLPIIKSSSSKISQLVMEKIKNDIVTNCDIKFDKEYIKNIVNELLKNDITLIANYYNVKNIKHYSNRTSIQAQISEAYGEGQHYLVPNSIIGKVGKGKKYCSIEEAKRLSIDDLDLKQVWDTELCIFIRDWEHPLFTKQMERAELMHEKKKAQELDKYLKSDLFDKRAVGFDISDEEYIENEKWFETN